MLRRLTSGVALMAMLLVAACGNDDAGTSAKNGNSGGSSDKPILIGIAAAKTGGLSPVDLQPAQAFQMRVKEINAVGGVSGRKLTVKWIDTQSDKALAANAAQELMSQGAAVIIVTCDFDYSAPAVFAAKARKVPALSFCAESPKIANPSVVGTYGGSMGEGSDTEGVTIAEWAHEARPEWKRAFVLRDTSIAYSKATSDYFTARWKQLGGQICGNADFVGGENTDVGAQVTAIRGAASKCDVVYVGSWLPGGAVAVRQIRDAGVNLPIASNTSDDGKLLLDIAGKVSNYYALPYVCMPATCAGGDDPKVAEFADKFKGAYGKVPLNSYASRGYDLASAVGAALDKAAGINGTAIAEGFWSLPKLDTMHGPVRFTPECHRPQPARHVVVEYTNGKGRQLAIRDVTEIPDIGDSNPCAGRQIETPK